VIFISDIPFWMAFVSLISSAVVTVAMFIFVFHLTTFVLASLGASLILQLIPVFWFSSVYGFCSVVALGFLIVSVVLFQSALSDRLSRYKYLLNIGGTSLIRRIIIEGRPTIGITNGGLPFGNGTLSRFGQILPLFPISDLERLQHTQKGLLNPAWPIFSLKK